MKRIIKYTILFIILLGLTTPLVATENDTTKIIQYSENELIAFLDSIGQLNPDAWVEELSFMVDSTLYNQKTLNKELTTSDFEKLKKAVKDGFIDTAFALQIFPELEFDTLLMVDENNSKLAIEFYSFDEKKEDFKEFAILIGYGNGLFMESDVYFFHNKKIIAKHSIFYRYELELKHFKDENNNTVIYYNVCYSSGTGIWWFQLNFYRYNNDQLQPVFTEIQNINLQFFTAFRVYNIQSEIVNERPLQLKFVYEDLFFSSYEEDRDLFVFPTISFIKDTTIVTYHIEKQSGKFIPDFSNSKLNRNKLLSYFLGYVENADSEIPFINAHYELFKNGLRGNDPILHDAILNYLNEIKNALEKR